MIVSVFAIDLAYADEQKATIVTPNGLNVRAGAGTNNPIVISLPFETEVTIIGEDSDKDGNKWYKISKVIGNDTIIGFVMAKIDYIVINGQSSTEEKNPIVEPHPYVSQESNCSYADVLMEVGRLSGMNPYVIAATIIVEQGVGGSGASISGNVSGYEGYYNYFNISAVSGSGRSAVENGLRYAQSSGSYERPWYSRYRSILGGAEMYSTNYINNNQNTLYFKKWNVMNGLSNVSNHQYMTNIEAAYEEAKNLKNGYIDLIDEPFNFIIPVYENMPEEVSLPPSELNNDQILSEAAASVTDENTDIQEINVVETYVPVNDFETSMYNLGFPLSYLSLLSQMHESHPTWTFTPAITGLDWEEVVKKEAVLGRSLVSKSKGKYWKSQKSPAYNSETGTYKSYDSGGWNAASTVAVKYFLDPRRFISETGIFIFMSHEYNPQVQTIEGLNHVIKNTFMAGAFPEFVDAFYDEELEKAKAEEKKRSIIQGVESTTIKNSSSLTSKGIKLSWKKSPGYKVDYYEVYRSVEKNKGYGKEPFYVTPDGNKITYVNTKQLENGTRYYFKIRGVRVIDDVKYYTEYSNKCWRTFKK